MRFFAALLEKLNGYTRRDLFALLGVLAPLIFVGFTAAMFSGFVVGAVLANITINLGILLAALFGVLLIVDRLLDAQLDYRTIYRFGQEASEGTPMGELLEQPWLRNRYVRHYLTHIANTGGTLSTQLEHSSIESELHELSADYESRMELPQFLVGFMIAMGLLGTFIGLLETLTGISGMLNGLGGTGDVQAQFLKLVVELRKPLAGMGIAFSASMFGLITSLMLAIMMTSLRRYIRQVISLARNVMHDLTNVARQNDSRLSQFGGLANANGRGGAGGGGGGVALRQNLEQVYDQAEMPQINVGFQSSVELFVKKIELLVATFNAHGENTRKQNDLLGVGPRMKETHEKSLEVLKTLAVGVEEQQRTMAEVITAIEAMSESQRQLHNKQQSTVQSLIEVNTGMSRAMFSLLESHRSAHTEQKAELQALSEVTSEVVRFTGLGVDAQKQLRTELSSLVRNLGTQIGDLRDVEISGGRHLNEMKEGISKLVDSMGLIDIIAGNMSEQSALVGNLTDTLRLLHRDLAERSKLISNDSGAAINSGGGNGL